MKKRKLFYLFISLVLVVSLIAAATHAAFTDEGKVLGSTFSVGSANIMFLKDLSLGSDQTNLAEELTGPAFTNVGPGWTKDYLIKIINTGTSKIGVTSHAYYETANDPKDLRSDIDVEFISWNDANSNGVVDTGEEGIPLGKKRIIS